MAPRPRIQTWARCDEQARPRHDAYQRRQTAHAIDHLCKQVGRRYANCRFRNFVAAHDKQKAVFGEIVAFAKDIARHIDAGHNVLLYGPAGTGKDHLLTALMIHTMATLGNFAPPGRHSYGADESRILRWWDGANLFASIRAEIGENGGYQHIIDGCCRATVLAISDPLPPRGGLTDFQRTTIFEIVDRRYRAARPTWLTCNVSGRSELEERLGIQTADRLRDGALTLFFDWESYRRPLTLQPPSDLAATRKNEA